MSYEDDAVYPSRQMAQYPPPSRNHHSAYAHPDQSQQPALPRLVETRFVFLNTGSARGETMPVHLLDTNAVDCRRRYWQAPTYHAKPGTPKKRLIPFQKLAVRDRL